MLVLRLSNKYTAMKKNYVPDTTVMPILNLISI